MLCSNDTGDAQLPGDDSSMAGAASLVCDNGRCYLHDGLPVRISHGGNEYLTLSKLTNMGAVLYDMGSALADLTPHCLAGKDGGGSA